MDDLNNNQDKEQLYIESNQGSVEALISATSTNFKPTRKSNFKAYLSLIIITTIISSAITSSILYSKLSQELQKSLASVQNVIPVSNDSLKNTSYTTGYSVVDIAKKMGPSIVGIRMTVSSPQSRFSGGQSSAEGSGIIISKDGYIMTNYHVVEYADSGNTASSNTALEVFLPDKRQVKAKFIGGDKKNDLAVIKIDLDNLPVAELGDSSKLEVGEPLIAIGNPLGMDFAGSVTTGVVSALNRTVEMEDKTLNTIQTDAAINPGNSGGALVNSSGQVIGINTVKISEAGVEGLGFAIPINDAKPIVDQLIMFGYIKGRPLIGISGQEITEVISKQYNLPVGIYVMTVSPNSGAYNAGIKTGDTIISLAGKDVKTMADMDNIKKDYKAGDTVDAVVVRNGNKLNLKLTFSEER